MQPRDETAPRARDRDPLAPGTFEDPAATYAELRDRCPVAHTDRWGGFWALTRYDDITAVAADHETFTTATQNLVPASPRSGVPRRPLQVDPPEHARFRRAMNPYFDADRVALLEPTLRQAAHRFLQPLLDRGRGDLADDWARHLPVRAVCAFLRVPEEDADWMQTRRSPCEAPGPLTMPPAALGRGSRAYAPRAGTRNACPCAHGNQTQAHEGQDAA